MEQTTAHQQEQEDRSVVPSQTQASHFAKQENEADAHLTEDIKLLGAQFQYNLQNKQFKQAIFDQPGLRDLDRKKLYQIIRNLKRQQPGIKSTTRKRQCTSNMSGPQSAALPTTSTVSLSDQALPQLNEIPSSVTLDSPRLSNSNAQEQIEEQKEHVHDASIGPESESISEDRDQKDDTDPEYEPVPQFNQSLQKLEFQADNQLEDDSRYEKSNPAEISREDWVRRILAEETLMSNEKVREVIVGRLLKTNLEPLENICIDASVALLPSLIRRDDWKTIKKHCLMSWKPHYVIITFAKAMALDDKLELTTEVFKQVILPALKKLTAADIGLCKINNNRGAQVTQTSHLDVSTRTSWPPVGIDRLLADILFQEQAQECGLQVGTFLIAYASDKLNDAFNACRNTVRPNQTKIAVKEGLFQLGLILSDVTRKLTEDNCKLLCKTLVEVLREHLEVNQLRLVRILYKMEPIQHPTKEECQALMKDVLHRAHIIESIIVRAGPIKLSIYQLLKVLQGLRERDLSTLKRLLAGDSQQWLANIEIHDRIEEDDCLSNLFRTNESISAKFKSNTTFKRLKEMEIKLREQVKTYRVNDFQPAVACRALEAKTKPVVISQHPGTGKTYTIGLLALYLMNFLEIRVVIATSQPHLVEQLKFMLGGLTDNISVFMFSDLLQYDVCIGPNWAWIIDEADDCILSQGVSVKLDEDRTQLRGLWSLKRQLVFLLSGSFNRATEDIIHTILRIQAKNFVQVQDLLLEVSTGQHEIDEQVVEQFDCADAQEKKLVDEVVASSEAKPVIIFVDSDKKGNIVRKACKAAANLPCYPIEDWTHLETARILLRDRDRRVIVIMPRNFGRGTDLRFKVDAAVFVAFQPAHMAELNQLAGRCSRTGSQEHKIRVFVVKSKKPELQLSNEEWLADLKQKDLFVQKDGLLVLRILRQLQNLIDFGPHLPPGLSWEQLKMALRRLQNILDKKKTWQLPIKDVFKDKELSKSYRQSLLQTDEQTYDLQIENDDSDSEKQVNNSHPDADLITL